MVLTRSQAGGRQDDEERRRFLQERQEQTSHTGDVAEGQPAERAGPLRTATQAFLLEQRLVDSPASPPTEDRGEWQHSVDERSRCRFEHDTSLEQAPPADLEIPHGSRPSQSAQRPAERDRVAFADEPRHRPRSVLSAATNNTELRRKEAELEAAEQLAVLRRREIQVEEDLIRKRLAATIDRIEVEGSRAGGSVAESVRRVGNWLEGVQPAANEPETRRSRDVSPMLGRSREVQPTPRRPREVSPRRLDNRGESSSFSRRDRSVSRGRAIDRLTDHLETMMRPPPRQVYELPNFAGEPSEWLTFVNSYNESTMRYKFSNFENVARLRHALKGEARQCVHHMLASSSRPDLILRVLKKNFGRTDLLIDRAIEELKKMPAVGPSATDLNSFAIKIMNIVSTLVDHDKRTYGANPLLIREITERLSPHLRSRWCAYAKQNIKTAESELMLMAEFLLDESDAELEFSHARAPHKRTVPAPATAELRTQRRYPDPVRLTQKYGAGGAGGGSGGGGIRRPQPSRVQTYAVERADPCLCCGGAHRTPECRQLTSMDVGARWDWARQSRVCFKCLDKRHRRENCKAKGCGITGCPHSHHRMLHEQGQRTMENQVQSLPADRGTPPAAVTSYAAVPRVAMSYSAPAPAVMPQTAAAYATAPQAREMPRAAWDGVTPTAADHEFTSTTADYGMVASTVLLKVMPVILAGPRGEVATFALLDEGSTVSLVDEQLANEIGAVGAETTLFIQGVGTMSTSQQSRRVQAHVRGWSGGPAHSLTLRTVRDLGLRGQRADRVSITKYPHLADMGEVCYDAVVPRVLIGADHWNLTLPLEARVGRINEPAALRTPLGWVIYGTVPRMISTSQNVMTLHCHESNSQDGELNNLLKNYFSIDSLGVSQNPKTRPQDQRATDIFNRTVNKIDGPRYEVGQLWRDDEPKLPPSYHVALTRLRGVERKMDRDSSFQSEYTSQIDNLLAKGYAERVTELRPTQRDWYLPHFAVRNVNKPGKMRLVFDAAATSQGRNLNDFLLEGPDLLQSLLGILFRFREGAYAVTADIGEMFLQVRIRPEDKAAQMFLWRGSDRTRPPCTYKMNSMIFGAASSPFLAHSVRNRNALDNAEIYPLAVEDICKNHYMDDFVASYDTEPEAIERAEQVAKSHLLGGFTLRGWSSNAKELMRRIQPEVRASTPALLGEKSQKILGMLWDAEDDVIRFNTKMIRVPVEVKSLERGPTKREALSAVMSIYDPLGLLSHYTITAKVQLQRLWGLRLGWDEKLPQDEQVEFQRWLQSLEHVAALRVPRRYATTGGAPRRELHVFVDASAQAYAAATYWRTENHGEVRISLAAAKAKVAPTKPLSIPRLELQSALLGARLQRTIVAEHRYEVSRVVLWTDSRTVLHWVRDDARRYTAYVAHRLGEISELTNIEQWRWVPTKLNPADDATRADSSRKITSDERWYVGPEFLQHPEAEWPQEPSLPAEPVEETQECGATHETSAPLPDVARFSDYNRLIRATARCLQFIERLKSKTPTELQVKHLLGAEHLWYQRAQRQDFPDELRSLIRGEPVSKKSRVHDLDPVLDADGVMRMRGRINAAPVQTTVKKPIILDGKNSFVRLLVQHAHKQAAHANNERVVNDLRKQYWILRLRPTVRAVANSCQMCILRRARPQVPALGDLPLARIEPFHRAFTNAAVDLFGPLTVTIGRRHEKRWVALFTCLTTRAVHLEIVHTLSTSSAIMALRRMAARRGWPKMMYSDNGTNFRGADAELRAAFAEWLPALKDYALQNRMSWRFIPPGAPNQGGAWERMVRSVKAALTATLHTRAPKEEVFATLLAEAEHVVNSRPLTHVSVDPGDEEALTPNHFLLGGSTGVPITGPCDEADRRTWRASQALADHFWSRWVREYLPTLAPRRSSAVGGRQLTIGDLVLVVDPTLPRNVWPRGVIEATFPGPDGAVRSADVRTKGGVFRRPTSRLAVLTVQPEPPQQRRRGENCDGQRPAGSREPGELD